MRRGGNIIRAILAVVASAALLMTAACAPSQDNTKGPLVLAAASLQDALTQAAQAWSQKGHAEPVLSFAATSALAQQIKAGAPADMFVSADERWMDDLEADRRIDRASRRDLLGNVLVLVVAADADVQFEKPDAAALARALGDGRIALADPQAVPAGRYAKQALTSLGAWDGVSARVIPAENVRMALALVARGDARLGIVYATDAKAEPAVRTVHVFPPTSHARIVYPAALLKTGTHSQANAFLDFLGSDEAAAIFRKHGFTIPAAR